MTNIVHVSGFTCLSQVKEEFVEDIGTILRTFFFRSPPPPPPPGYLGHKVHTPGSF